MRPGKVASSYHCGLSDPITDLDRSSILASARHYLWLGGQCVSETEQAVPLCTYMLMCQALYRSLSPQGGGLRFTARDAWVASHAVPICERTPLVALPLLTPCTPICDLILIVYRSQGSSSTLCVPAARKIAPSEWGIGHMSGRLCCPTWEMSIMKTPVHFDLLASTA